MVGGEATASTLHLLLGATLAFGGHWPLVDTVPGGHCATVLAGANLNKIVTLVSHSPQVWIRQLDGLVGWCEVVTSVLIMMTS